jgi:hypothetical protein
MKERGRRETATTVVSGPVAGIDVVLEVLVRRRSSAALGGARAGLIVAAVASPRRQRQRAARMAIG